MLVSSEFTMWMVQPLGKTNFLSGVASKDSVYYSQGFGTVQFLMATTKHFFCKLCEKMFPNVL